MDVQGRVRLRFVWTDLKEGSNFDYGATKKGAKVKAEMSIFGPSKQEMGVTIGRRSAAGSSMLLHSTQEYTQHRRRKTEYEQHSMHRRGYNRRSQP